MGVALSVLIIFFALLPGFMFLAACKGYYGGEKRNEAEKSRRLFTFFDRDGLLAFPIAIAFHMAWVPLVPLTTSLKVDFDTLISLLFGTTDITGELNLQSIIDYPLEIAVYFASISLASLLVGTICSNFFLRMNLHRKYQFLRFKKHWDYILSGEYAVFEENKVACEVNDISNETNENTKSNNQNSESGHSSSPEVNKPDLVHLAATVQFGSITFIYLGVLSEYWFDDRGGLSHLVLEGTVRRKISEDREDQTKTETVEEYQKRFYQVEGDYIILDYSRITSLNVNYVYIRKAS